MCRRLNRPINFRFLSACGVNDADEVHRWLDALGRVRRARGRRSPGTPVPYRGLKSFQPEDAHWFYGRRQLTDVLLENLRDLSVGRPARRSWAVWFGQVLAATRRANSRAALRRAGHTGLRRLAAHPDDARW